MKRSVSRSLLLAAALVAIVAAPVWACSVPVFRYALERWPADPYELVVFHRGPLSEAHATILDELDSPDPNGPHALSNVAVRTVDLDDVTEAELLALWEQQATDELPWVVARYPRAAGVAGQAWSGPLERGAIKRLVDSPLRQEIARRLLAGDSAVWVLLEIGDKPRDEAAMKTLTEQLALLEQSLRLPEIEQRDVDDGLLAADPDALKLAFSTVRLARDDAAERALADMLLGTERDLRDLKEPMAFPVFGRGRVLYALVGEGINPDTIRAACAELIGPCTCTVKDENPGVDLVMAVDWDGRIEDYLEAEPELPPLTDLVGFGSIDGDPVAGAGSAAASGTGDNAASRTTDNATTAGSTDVTRPSASPTGDSGTSPAASSEAGSLLSRNILTTALLGLAAVVGATLFVLLRRR